MAFCSSVYSGKANKTAADEIYNAPLDIVSYKGDPFSATDCTNRCLYWYNYATPSSAVITNETTSLKVDYDGGGDVTFNSAKYTPKIVRFFKPSIHRFDGENVDHGEIIIEHIDAGSGMAGMFVCIPLSTTGMRSDASQIVEQIISNAPNRGQAPKRWGSSFTLNAVIPRAAYYTYDGPAAYTACNTAKVYKYVVFHPASNGAITINATAVTKLGQLIQSSFIVANKSASIFFNSKGTSSNGFNGEDQIYIQCKPTDNGDGETKVYKDPISPFGASDSDMQETLSVIISIIIGIVLIFVGLSIWKTLTSFLTSDAVTKPAPFDVKVGGGWI